MKEDEMGYEMINGLPGTGTEEWWSQKTAIAGKLYSSVFRELSTVEQVDTGDFQLKACRKIKEQYKWLVNENLEKYDHYLVDELMVLLLAYLHVFIDKKQTPQDFIYPVNDLRCDSLFSLCWAMSQALYDEDILATADFPPLD
jgi:hypothetical protein